MSKLQVLNPLIIPALFALRCVPFFRTIPTVPKGVYLTCPQNRLALHIIAAMSLFHLPTVRIPRTLWQRSLVFSLPVVAGNTGEIVLHRDGAKAYISLLGHTLSYLLCREVALFFPESDRVHEIWSFNFMPTSFSLPVTEANKTAKTVHPIPRP